MTGEDEPLWSEGVQYAIVDKHRTITNSSSKNEVTGPKRKWYSVVDASAGESKSDDVKNNMAQEPGKLGS